MATRLMNKTNRRTDRDAQLALPAPMPRGNNKVILHWVTAHTNLCLGNSLAEEQAGQLCGGAVMSWQPPRHSPPLSPAIHWHISGNVIYCQHLKYVHRIRNVILRSKAEALTCFLSGGYYIF